MKKTKTVNKAKSTKKAVNTPNKAKSTKKAVNTPNKAKSTKKVTNRLNKTKTIKAKDFDSWWKYSKCENKISNFEKKWLKQNKPNEEEEPGGDYWHVNQMVHDGDCFGMTYDISKEIFDRVLAQGIAGKPTQCDSLYCALDDIIWEACEFALELLNEKKEV